jgi:hypothetical protein
MRTGASEVNFEAKCFRAIINLPVCVYVREQKRDAKSVYVRVRESARAR